MKPERRLCERSSPTTPCQWKKKKSHHHKIEERTTEAESSLIKVLYASLEVFSFVIPCSCSYWASHLSLSRSPLTALAIHSVAWFHTVELIFRFYFVKWKRRANRTKPLSCSYLVAFLFYIRSTIQIVFLTLFYLYFVTDVDAGCLAGWPAQRASKRL